MYTAPPRFSSKRRLLGALTMAGALVLAGCSTEADEALESESPGADGDLVTLTVANLPIADQGSYFYALDNGIFEEHGLQIETADTAGGSAAIAAMLAGEFDIVYSGADGVIKAAANDLPVKIIAGANTNQPEGEVDSANLVAAAGITDVSELDGATIGTNALGNINQVYAQEFLAQNGVEDVEIVEIPFPEQVAALESGQIQATLIPEPFASQALADGATILGSPYRIGKDQTTGVGVFASSEDIIAEKVEALTAFTDAMDEAAVAANDPANRDAVVESILSHTQLEADVANEMTFVQFTSDVTSDQIQSVADLLVKYEVLPENIDADEIFADMS